ncbi:ABC transporter substrate-binding protein [Paenibacillus sp. N4]|uniref:ABC transporter substrate-binding protein n=1 Tax=Paenibacillus vietnamensis TaxID=2590547 RepID=UPI001CD07663|nr:ABC transporter substrate-binding protein [Paenibacillus vietnamensis]MCA0756949.1 ABC transporter substrate-binding protein [Paenibacillus vietnamensis]
MSTAKWGKQQPRVLLSVLLTFILILMSACGSSNGDNGSNGNNADGAEGAAGKVTLTFWNGFTGPDGELLKTIVNDYNKANADKVEIKMDVMPWDQLNQKLPPAIATDTAPGLVAIIGGSATPFIRNDTFQDLSGFFEATGASKDDFKNGALELGVKEDKPYLLPMQMNGLYLFWNKTLFKNAGLDPEKAPATLEELTAYAEKLTDPAKNQYGFGVPVAGAAPYYASFIIGNGGNVVDLDTKKSVFDSPENTATFGWLQDLVVNKKVSPKGAAGADLEKMMMSGQLGMYINGPWMASGLKTGSVDFGVALPPKGSAAQFTELGGIGFAVPSGASDAEKQAAYDFINYWNSPEIVKKWSLANGFPPYIKSVVEDPEVQKDPLISAMANMGDAAKPFLPGLTTADRINNEVIFTAIEAVQNGQDVSEVLKQASGDIDELLMSEK